LQAFAGKLSKSYNGREVKNCFPDFKEGIQERSADGK
jgi:hypothetical protein